MKRMIVYGVICISIFTGISAYTQELQQAPFNPEFLHYQEQLKAGQVPKRTADGHSLGYRPAPIDLSYLKGQKIEFDEALPLRSIPSSYDLRTEGKLTSVKNQNPYGTCWAFATYGSLESCLLTSSSNNFSENNMVNLDGFDYGFDDGGVYYMSMAYLVRWLGPVNESADPYPDPGNSPSGLTVQKHVQQVLIIPQRSSATDNDDIKQAVMSYGALASCMYWNASYYNSTYYAFYYGSTNAANHAIAIVGWDDNFDKNKFPSTPLGNGAFLIRNSWGTADFGDSGYFYISYYDSRIGDENFLFNNAESTTNYNTNYQYDPLGWVTSFGYGSTTAWGANIFSASSAGSLRAVSFYAGAVSTSYEIYIYTGISSGQPRSGTLQTSKSGTLSAPGYHTISLDSAVSLSSGSSFSVVVKFTTSGYNYPIPIEYAVADYSSAATASAGQSYISSDGSTWEDLTSHSSTANNCIKAFAVSSSPPVVSVIVNDYDGDGKTDPALYHQSSGYWFMLFSSDGYDEYYLTTPLGGTGYSPLPGDYDGDGMEDFAVYDDISGYWYVRMSGSSYDLSSGKLGAWGYSPVPADFDGDSKTDLAVYQESSGWWYYILSSTYVFGYSKFGETGYTPVPGDYDGDGQTDLAVYHGASGYWYILYSGSGSLTYMSFRGQGYTPIQ